MKKTIPTAIIEYLERNGATLGGVLARRIGAELDKKESNVERRCRELVNDGKLKAEYVKIGGKGNEVVKYSLSEVSRQTQEETRPGIQPLHSPEVREERSGEMLHLFSEQTSQGNAERTLDSAKQPSDQILRSQLPTAVRGVQYVSERQTRCVRRQSHSGRSGYSGFAENSLFDFQSWCGVVWRKNKLLQW